VKTFGTKILETQELKTTKRFNVKEKPEPNNEKEKDNEFTGRQ